MGIFMELILNIVLAVLIFIAGVISAADYERRKWCENKYKTLENYRACLESPDWEKK